MNEEDLVKEFMELSLYDLEYIIGVEIDNARCLRHNKDIEITKINCLDIITKLINLKDSYEFYNEE